MEREKVDRLCRTKTASWVRLNHESNKVKDIEDTADLCSFYEGYYSKQDEVVLKKGIYTLDDLKKIGMEKGMCPYYMARQYILRANVVVFNYSYMLDPKISGTVTAELQKDSIILFDECHNIDNVCIEGFSMNLDRKTL